MTGNRLPFSWSEWSRLDGLDLARLVRAGEVQASEVAHQAVAAVQLADPQIEAVLELFEDVVESPREAGAGENGLYYGAPLLLKDFGSGWQGRKLEGGSRLFLDTRAPHTDPLVENFLAGGFSIIGRSAVPELCVALDTATSYLGALKVTRNPWHLPRTPGGSSGGAAAAVASGMVPVAMGSDGGGSIRIPAGFTALVGLKPGRGRVPTPLSYNEYMYRSTSEGVLTRTVRDAAATLDVMACACPNGGAYMPIPGNEPYLEVIERDPPRLRIALSTGSWGRPGECDPEVANRIREVAALLTELGHRVEEVDDADICDWEVLWRGFTVYWVGGFGAALEQVLRSRGVAASEVGPTLRAQVSPMVYGHWEMSRRFDKFDVYDSQSCNNLAMRSIGRFMSRYDALLCPTAAIRVPQANGPYSTLHEGDFEQWFERVSGVARYTMPGNETGLPGISVPAGWDRDGLPIGAMFYANWLREDLLLQLAAQLERARAEWFRTLPPHHVAAGSGRP